MDGSDNEQTGTNGKEAERRRIAELEDQLENMRVVIEDAQYQNETLAKLVEQYEERLREVESTHETTVRRSSALAERDERLQHLAQRLRDANEALRGRTKEAESAARLALEQQQSHEIASEELREANEELATAAEELLSINAELTESRDALEQSEARLLAVMDNVVDALITIDESGKVLSFNPAAERIFGYRADDVIGHNISMLMPEPYASEHDGYLANYLRTGTAKIIGIGREVTGRRKDGTTFPIELAVGEAHRGEERYFIGTVRDITRRKVAENELARERGFISSVLQTTDALVVVTNAGGGIVSWNRACEELTGYPFDVVRWKPVWEVAVPSEDVETARVFYGRPPPGDFPRRDEGEWVTRDGRRRLIAWSHSAMLDELGEVEHVVSTGMDITDARDAEARLRQAQKMEAIGQLTGGIAHDFNNLLAVLMMDLEELARSHEGSEKTEDLIAEAREVAQSGAELTARLLAFSRRQDLDPAVGRLEEIIAGCTALLRRTIGEHVDLDVVMPRDLWPVFVDRRQLETALINLAVNARDAMPSGGQITFSATNVHLDEDYTAAFNWLDEGEYVQLNVTDTGTGIPKEIQQRVFDPFFTTKEVGSGTGLGLSMVYGFMKHSRGHVSIYSEEGHGTTVSLYLPRAVSDTDLQRPDEPEPVGEPTGSETILLVEDFPQLRNRGAQMLAGLGYRVVEAQDANEAVAELEAASRVDLLFTDIVMPGGMNGFELAETARRYRPGLKVLYTSGYAEGAEVEMGIIEAGAIRLHKPYSRQDLARAVRRVLDTTG